MLNFTTRKRIMKHFTSNILMVSPEKFRANEFTMDDNVFQSKKTIDVSIKALNSAIALLQKCENKEKEINQLGKKK